MRLPWGRIVRVVLALLILGVVLVAVTPQGRTGLKTALFIPQTLPGLPVRPQGWFTRTPIKEEVSYPLASSIGVADLYRPPGDGPYPAVLLFLGVNPAGRDDPRVVRLADGLARSGMVVLIPWSESMVEKRIEVEGVDNLVHAFQYLRDLEMVDPSGVGMGGFCVGASLAAVAAEDPRINQSVAFVNFFGGYYRLVDLVVAISSRQSVYGDTVEAWEPDSLTQEVFTAHLIKGVADVEDRETLTRIFVGRDAGARQRAGELSPHGQIVFRLLDGATSVAEARQLVSQLPAEVQREMEALSPETYIDRLEARVLIMHDREDDLVPAEESRRLADALRERGNVYYTEFSFFQHVDPTRGVSPLTYARELGKLFLHLYSIMRAAS